MIPKIKKLLLILLCLQLSGCATIFKGKELERRVSQLEESLLDKDGQIEKLRGLLKKKEDELQAKNAKIEELRKKLESVGVFTK